MEHDEHGQEQPFEQPPAERMKWTRLRRRLGWLTLLAMLLLAAGGYCMLRYGALPVGSIMQSTRILDSEGALLASVQGGVNRQTVKLANISPWLVKATVAIEDRRFYEHAGVDIRGLARAAWVDIRNMSKQQGASTLTQQLARNLYLSQERTWSRKLKEAWYAARLEQSYSKDEILELYLNQIYYGHGAYGAEAAARLYFDKSAKQLSIAESALLAGIPKGPRYYSPHLHPIGAKARRQQVIEAMLETRQITADQARKASAKPLGIRTLPEEQSSAAPYFVDYVKKVAVDRLGIDERLINEGGLRIYTTLDARVQKNAEDTVKQGLPGGDSELQAALVAIDPRNGYIKAMVGGRNYRRNQYNRVFATSRQPGSSFKPILYAAALDRRAVTPATRFRSEPTLFYFDGNRQMYRPSNYNNRYFNGEIGLRQAIAASDNIYAVNTIMQVGPEQVIELARKLGITSSLHAVPSLALGTFPVSPFEMASAYAVFAAQGRKAEPIAITRILDARGDIIYEAHPRTEQAISPALAYVTTRLLEGVFERGGTGHRISRLLTRPVAGKTGTTDSDAWFVGYTPELTTAVWVGYDKGRKITSSEAHRAAPIFAKFTEAALANVTPSAFTMPEGVVNVTFDPATNLLAAPECPAEWTTEAFLAGTEPTETCALHRDPSDAPSEHHHGGLPWWRKFKSWW